MALADGQGREQADRGVAGHEAQPLPRDRRDAQQVGDERGVGAPVGHHRHPAFDPGEPPQGGRLGQPGRADRLQGAGHSGRDPLVEVAEGLAAGQALPELVERVGPIRRRRRGPPPRWACPPTGGHRSRPASPGWWARSRCGRPGAQPSAGPAPAARPRSRRGRGRDGRSGGRPRPRPGVVPVRSGTGCPRSGRPVPIRVRRGGSARPPSGELRAQSARPSGRHGSRRALRLPRPLPGVSRSPPRPPGRGR